MIVHGHNEFSHVNHETYSRVAHLLQTSQLMPCQWRKYGFYVVGAQGPAILGLRACEQMGIVTIHAKRDNMEY